MDTIFKSDQIYILSDRLGLSQKSVKSVLDNYINRLIEKAKSGKPVKFLNICYIINSDSKLFNYNETLAYISSEISKDVKLGKDVVFRILSEFSVFIADDLKKFYSYTIRGLVSISLEEYKTGVYKVRIRTSKSLREVGARLSLIHI